MPIYVDGKLWESNLTKEEEAEIRKKMKPFTDVSPTGLFKRIYPYPEELHTSIEER